MTFTVSASGAAPLVYQWRLNGASLAGATSASYTIASAQDSNAGNYSLLVTNANGSDVSSNAVLTINHPPSLAAIAHRTVDELTTMTISTSVSDPDGGAMAYALLAAPSGATINPGGVISWTPTEAQGPSTNTFTVQVTDDGSPGLTDTKSFTVIVNEVNSPPVLTVPPNQTLYGLATLLATNTATDPDIPANTLTFSLVSAPTGMAIGAASGVTTWTPSGSQCPSTNFVSVAVTDNGVPPLSVTNTFTVTVLQIATAVALSSSLNPTSPGSNITLTAGVSLAGSGSGTPTGTVQFRTNGVAMGAPAIMSGGATALGTALLAHGSNTVTAEYSGDGVFKASTNNLVQIVNTPPVPRTNHILATKQNTPVAESGVKLVRTDTDADYDPLTMTSVSSPSTNGGTVTLVSGTITYTPVNNFVGADSFSYTVTDGYASVTGAVYVTVTSTNAQTINIVRGTLLPGGSFRVICAGIPATTYYVQATTNLNAAHWVTISTNVTAATGLLTNDDANAINYPAGRLYRTSLSP